MLKKVHTTHIFILYFFCIFFISLFDLFIKQKYNNFLIFYYSFEHFLDQSNLYTHYAKEYFDLFKYSPMFPLFMLPFYIFPIKLAAIIWNLFNALFVFFGVYVQKLTNSQKVCCLLIILPEIINNAHNFQSNGIIAGGALFCFYLIETNRLYLGNIVLQALLILKLYGFFFAYQYIFKNPKEVLKQISFFMMCVTSILVISISFTNFEYIKQQFISFYGLTKLESSGYGDSVMGLLSLCCKSYTNTHIIQAIGFLLFAFLTGLVRRKNSSLLDRYSLFIIALIFIIIFNHRAENPTMIIASVGIGLYLVLYKSGSILKDWVFWMKMIGVSLLQTDIVPHAIRKSYIYPYHVKVIPFVIFFIFFYILLLRQWVSKPKQILSTPAKVNLV